MRDSSRRLRLLVVVLGGGRRTTAGGPRAEPPVKQSESVEAGRRRPGRRGRTGSLRLGVAQGSQRQAHVVLQETVQGRGLGPQAEDGGGEAEGGPEGVGRQRRQAELRVDELRREPCENNNYSLTCRPLKQLLRNPILHIKMKPLADILSVSENSNKF